MKCAICDKELISNKYSEFKCEEDKVICEGYFQEYNHYNAHHYYKDWEEQYYFAFENQIYLLTCYNKRDYDLCTLTKEGYCDKELLFEEELRGFEFKNKDSFIELIKMAKLKVFL